MCRPIDFSFAVRTDEVINDVSTAATPAYYVAHRDREIAPQPFFDFFLDIMSMYNPGQDSSKPLRFGPSTKPFRSEDDYRRLFALPESEYDSDFYNSFGIPRVPISEQGAPLKLQVDPATLQKEKTNPTKKTALARSLRFDAEQAADRLVRVSERASGATGTGGGGPSGDGAEKEVRKIKRRFPWSSKVHFHRFPWSLPPVSSRRDADETTPVEVILHQRQDS